MFLPASPDAPVCQRSKAAFMIMLSCRRLPLHSENVCQVLYTSLIQNTSSCRHML